MTTVGRSRVGSRFDALSSLEQAAVAAFVRAEYDRMVFQRPACYLSRNAAADPEQWQASLREVIACDPLRVRAIVEAGKASPTGGFTLIELSIVLVIIGLIVGGVLVGQDLIRAAEVRATISQIEKYNTAVNTFLGKYGALPGDMNVATATQFGFSVGGGCNGGMGGRDGNGVIDGAPEPYPLQPAVGEEALFWEDLTTAGLIDGNFASGAACNWAPTLSAATLAEFFPPAKIGGNNYFYVYEVNGVNWFAVSEINSYSGAGGNPGTPDIPASQAYNIDKKMDDGLPTTGNVLATYVSASTGPAQTAPNAAADSATTCYNTTGPAYSIGWHNGVGPNCALSFRFQ